MSSLSRKQFRLTLVVALLGAIGSGVQGCRLGYELLDDGDGAGAGDGAQSGNLGGSNTGGSPMGTGGSSVGGFGAGAQSGGGSGGLPAGGGGSDSGGSGGGGTCSPTATDDSDCDGLDSDCDGYVDEDCFTPPPVFDDSLLLWLDGSDVNSMVVDGGVQQWLDKSGKDHHVEQSSALQRPAFVANERAGLGVVRFDGTNDSLVYANATGAFDTAQLTILLVLSPEWTSSPGSNPSPLAIRGNHSGLTRISLHIDGALQNIHHFNGAYQQFAPHSITTGEYYLLDYSFGASQVVHRINGAQRATNTAPELDDALQPLRIGAAQNDLEHFNGVIAEVFVYDRTLDETEREAMQTYVQDKWGIEMAP